MRMVGLTLNAVETNLYYSFGALEGAVSEINILMRKFSQVFVRLSLTIKRESKLNLLCSVPKHWATDFMTASLVKLARFSLSFCATEINHCCNRPCIASLLIQSCNKYTFIMELKNSNCSS